MPKMLSTNLAHSQSLDRFVSACPRLEVEGISAGQFSGEQFGLNGRVGLFCSSSKQSVVTSRPLRHQDIQDIIFEAKRALEIVNVQIFRCLLDLPCWVWHSGINCLGEYVEIVLCVGLD
jgi:hypothetical protein